MEGVLSATWSPDGSRIVFASDRDGPATLYQKAASGAEPEQPLLKTMASKFPTDGRAAIIRAQPRWRRGTELY